MKATRAPQNSTKSSGKRSPAGTKQLLPRAERGTAGLEGTAAPECWRRTNAHVSPSPTEQAACSVFVLIPCCHSEPGVPLLGETRSWERRAGAEPSHRGYSRGAEPLVEFKAGALALNKSHSRNQKTRGSCHLSCADGGASPVPEQLELIATAASWPTSHTFMSARKPQLFRRPSPSLQTPITDQSPFPSVQATT